MTDLSMADATPPGALSRLLRRKMAVVGLALIALVVAGAVFARWIAPFDPNDQMFDGLTLEGAPMPPGGQFLMGTDLLGRPSTSYQDEAGSPR